MALQVTIFPDSGVCVGITIHHVVADGRSSSHFMKSWASVCRLGDASSLDSLPFYDRSVIKDPNGLETIFSTQLEKLMAEMGSRLTDGAPKSRVDDSVLATFVLKRADIERLRRSVSPRGIGGDNMRWSTFVLTCAYVWVCLAKARHDDAHDTEHFGFVVDCRARLDPPVPVTYFGNCIGACYAEAKRSDMVGEDGTAVASEAIGNSVRSLGNGVLRGAEDWIPMGSVIMDRMISVAGSPIVRFCDTDFGWGRACKVEVVSIEGSNSMSLAENRNEEEGGVEIGSVRPKHEMDAFAFLFQEGLKGEGLKGEK